MEFRRAALAACALAFLATNLPTGEALAEAPLARPVRLLPPTGDASVAAFEVPADREPRLGRRRLIALVRGKLKYVFVLFQENRSFDFCFGTFPGVDGLYSRPAHLTPGLVQPIQDLDGTMTSVRPFRVGPGDYAADLDDVDHTHAGMDDKLDAGAGGPRMDRFALAEERTHFKKGGRPSLAAKQFGELTMAHVDGDTIPFLWRYANRFAVFDHIFQLMVGPSTPGAISILAAQTGQTQAALHPDERFKGRARSGAGEPVLNDAEPFWGSRGDGSKPKMPFDPNAYAGGKRPDIAYNQTYASLPLSLAGSQAARRTSTDPDRETDLKDLGGDLAALSRGKQPAFSWGWYQEGFGGTDHGAYISHHNGAQYFGYIVNSPAMAAGFHDLGDFYVDLSRGALPQGGGVFYVRGGYHNLDHLLPVDPDPAVRKKFRGDDDHPRYSDSQISEAMLAKSVNAIARSRYWDRCAIIITYDESGGFYDHVPPPVRLRGAKGQVLGDGARIPLLLISPYDRAHTVVSETGDHGSVIKFVDAVFGLRPLARLPDEVRGRRLGRKRWGQSAWGPDDAGVDGVSDLVDALDPARLSGAVPALPRSYAVIPDPVVDTLPRAGGYGLKDIGVVPVDRALGIPNPVPPDFNPRPETDPSPPLSWVAGAP